MKTFFIEYAGTIIVGLALLAIVAAIVVKIVRDKRKGKCVSCSCGCTNCPKSAGCDCDSAGKDS